MGCTEHGSYTNKKQRNHEHVNGRRWKEIQNIGGHVCNWDNSSTDHLLFTFRK